MPPTHRWFAVLLVTPCLWAPACGSGVVDPGAATWLDAPLAAFPEDLADVGIYPSFPDTVDVHALAFSYEPRWPLWSNGLSKDRLLVLPFGEAITVGTDGLWSFPVGTLVFKTFASEAGDPVETRLIRRLEDGWDYAVYGWQGDGQEALRLDISASTPARVTRADGTDYEHRIPSEKQCQKCHESGVDVLLGLTPIQLGTADDDEAWTPLEAMVAGGLFSTPARTEPETIAGPDALTTEVMGYFTGNCVHCHNGLDGPSNSFDLRHDVMLDNTIGVESESTWGVGPRIVPGHPEQSMLFVGFSMETEDPEIKDMPPLGVQVRDAEAVELLRTWILALGEGP